MSAVFHSYLAYLNIYLTHLTKPAPKKTDTFETCQAQNLQPLSLYYRLLDNRHYFPYS